MRWAFAGATRVYRLDRAETRDIAEERLPRSSDAKSTLPDVPM